MPSFTSLFTLTTLALSLTTAAPVARDGSPKGWATSYLENYDTYHTRYLALSCQTQHNTTFFDSCCHPLLVNETLASRPANCTPTAVESSSAAVATASVSADDSGVDYSSASASATADSVVAQAAIHTAAAAQTTSTSAYVAPTTSTTAYVAPTTTSTKAAATTTASSGGGGDVMTGGFATYFYQGGNAGACGTVHSDSDYVIAIDAAGWWSNYESSGSSYCGKSITLTNTNNGKSVTAVVADVCPTCDTNNSLDLSVGAFQAIASESDGLVPITWVWA